MRIDHRNGTLHFGSQQLESDHVRSHLSTLAQRLSKAVHMMAPAESDAHAARRAAAIKTALENMEQVGSTEQQTLALFIERTVACFVWGCLCAVFDRADSQELQNQPF